MKFKFSLKKYLFFKKKQWEYVTFYKVYEKIIPFLYVYRGEAAITAEDTIEKAIKHFEENKYKEYNNGND